MRLFFMALLVVGLCVPSSAEELKTKKIEDLTIEELAMTADGKLFIASPPIPSPNLIRAVIYPKSKAKAKAKAQAKMEKK